MRQLNRVCVAAAFLAVFGTPALSAAEIQVAGEAPWQRPPGAPALTVVDHPGAWYSAALHGVQKPYPYSLRFLENQGNWHTPFNHPGMPGRYDIRGWHQ